jgi:protein required for attachment to host cells
MKPTKTWVVAADGARARVLLHLGPGKGLSELSSVESEAARKPGRELLADAPGRVFDSFGEGRHAAEPRTDPKTVEEQKFLREVAAMLERAAREGEYDRLVLCAAPRALGELRPLLSRAVRDRLAAELPKDLTRTPLDQLERSLEGALPV